MRTPDDDEEEDDDAADASVASERDVRTSCPCFDAYQGGRNVFGAQLLCLSLKWPQHATLLVTSQAGIAQVRYVVVIDFFMCPLIFSAEASSSSSSRLTHVSRRRRSVGALALARS